MKSRSLLAGLLLLVTTPLFAATINIDPGLYPGQWSISGHTAYTTGAATIELPADATYTLAFLSVDSFQFRVEADGTVAYAPGDPDAPFTLSANTLTFDNATVEVDLDGFGARWAIGSVTGAFSGNGQVTLVPGIRYRFSIVSIDSFLFYVNPDGTVSEDPGNPTSFATFAANRITMVTTYINVDLAGFGARWGIGAVAGANTGNGQAKLVPGIRYRFSIVSIDSFLFLLNADGTVSEDPDNPAPFATYSGNTITLVTTTVNVDRGGFTGGWGIGAVAGAHYQNGPVTLVPGLRYRFSIVSIDSFLFILNLDGSVAEDPTNPTVMATFSGSTISLVTTPVDVEVGGFAGRWSIGATAGSTQGNGSTLLIPDTTYRLTLQSIGSFLFQLNADGTTVESPLQPNPPATFSGSLISLITTIIAVDPGAYTGLWSIGATTGSISGPADVAAVTGFTYLLKTNTDGTIGSFFVDDLGACSQTSFSFSQGTISLDCGFAVTNIPPVADAGADQTVHIGTSVTLDGSNSTDPDQNTPLTFSWSMVTQPGGSVATIFDATLDLATLEPDVEGDYVISLVVTDSLGAASSADTVTVSTTNSAPVSNAGEDQLVTEIGTVVTLDGSGSDDADGDDISYRWTFLLVPEGSAAVLASADSSSPSFVADVHGDFIVSLTVTDEYGAVSEADSVTVSFGNLVPVADAGDNQSVIAGDLVSLDGTGSHDANLDSLSYSWEFTTIPAGSGAMISGANYDTASFVADLPGSYVVELTVNDGFVDSAPDAITVLATSRIDVLIQLINSGIVAINDLPASEYRNKQRSRALTNKLNAVLKQVDDGNYFEALSKLRDDVIGKLDGCANGSAVDRNDWIRSCSGQALVYPSLSDAIEELLQITGE